MFLNDRRTTARVLKDFYNPEDSCWNFCIDVPTLFKRYWFHGILPYMIYIVIVPLPSYLSEVNKHVLQILSIQHWKKANSCFIAPPNSHWNEWCLCLIKEFRARAAICKIPVACYFCISLVKEMNIERQVVTPYALPSPCPLLHSMWLLHQEGGNAPHHLFFLYCLMSWSHWYKRWTVWCLDATNTNHKLHQQG